MDFPTMFSKGNQQIKLQREGLAPQKTGSLHSVVLYGL